MHGRNLSRRIDFLVHKRSAVASRTTRETAVFGDGKCLFAIRCEEQEKSRPSGDNGAAKDAELGEFQ